MGRAPCCSKVGLHRGPWTSKEDALLTKYIQTHGEGQWRSLPKRAGLLRCGKSCRLRWMNYLRPDIKRGNITPEEDDLIIRMHSLLGNRWSLIAGRLPGRTDNEIKNYWNTHLSKRLRKQGTDPNTHKKLSSDQEITAKRSNTKKKKKKQQTKNEKMDSRENIVEEKEKTIYLPKPIRVSALTIQRTDSRTFTLDSNSASGSSSQDKEEESQEDQKEVNLAWAENDGFGFFIEDHDLVNGSQDHMECHGTLEKLYEEYFQLLKSDENVQEELDSFAQSLLI